MSRRVIDIDRWMAEIGSELLPWELGQVEQEQLLEDAFSKDLSFGTGGIRGKMGIGPNRMNRLTVGKASQGVANCLMEQKQSPVRVAIAFDTREHSLEFAKTTASVLAANGIHAYISSEPIPTPVLSYLVRRLKCDAGICITASHNPREYNGYKVYSSTGDQITDASAHVMQSHIEKVNPFNEVRSVPFDTGLAGGSISWIGDELLSSYLDAVRAQLIGEDCSNLKVVYSPLHGAGLRLSRDLLASLNVSYSVVADQENPDGSFPSCPKPNPENPDAMALGAEQMLQEDADLFLATDPDADRLGVMVKQDGKARLLSGDEVGLLLLDYIASSLDADGKKAYTTIVSTPLADKVADRHGLQLFRTLTGFKYIGEQIDMLEERGQADSFLFGFEESCGYLRGTYARDKDGIVALALVTECAAHYKREGKTLSDAIDGIYGRFGHMKGVQISKTYDGVEGRMLISRLMRSLRNDLPRHFGKSEIKSVIDYLHGALMPTNEGRVHVDMSTLPPSNVLEFRLADGSKVIIRPSGTEPKIKTYIFAHGATDQSASSTLGSLAAAVEKLFDRIVSRLKDTHGQAHIILLSGGSGTRLWPLSNTARSKQFLKVLRDEAGKPVSMVQRVFSQIESVDANVDITIATSSSQAESLSMQIGGCFALVAEPERRDTAAAIMLACSHLLMEQGAHRDDAVIVMPIDTFADQGYYDKIPTIINTIESGEYDLVLLGAEPTYPSEKYGYIIPSKATGDVLPVKTFKEKPTENIAKEYIAAGGLWNCGVFGFSLGYADNLVRGYFNASSYEDMLEHYSDLPKNSFDYEVVEHAEAIACIAYDGVWKDLGTWNTLTEEMADSVSGKAVLDECCHNVHVVNETSLPMVVAGVEDAVVVATPDGILVTNKERSAHIKQLVSSVANASPMYEEKSWGHYRTSELQAAVSNHRVEEMLLNAGKTIELAPGDGQRSVLIVVEGSATAVLREVPVVLASGASLTLTDADHCVVKADERTVLLLVDVN